MKYVIVEATFDPVSQRELDYAKALCKEENADLVFLMAKEEGIAPLNDRLALLKKATFPFRKLACGTKETLYWILQDSDTKIVSYDGYEKEEQEIREGNYRKAAQGTRAALVNEGLYFKEAVQVHCSVHRAVHSLGVADTAMHLAKVHHCDLKQAYHAGLLHDLTKAMPDEKAKELLQIYDPEQLQYNEKVWHSFTAPIVLRRDMGMRDTRMLNAIYHHTLGDGKSKLDRILYIADKIEPTRGYDSSAFMKASEESLKKGSDMVKNASDMYRKQRGEL